MKKGLEYCQRIENAIIIATFIVMVAAAFVQVVNRNITKFPISGLEEVSKYSMIYMVLLGTELGLRDGTQISVTGLVDKMSGITKKIFQIISKLIVVIFSVVMFIESLGLVQQQIRSGQLSPGLQLPMSIPYAALVISFGIITLVQGTNMIMMIINIKKTDEDEIEGTVGGEG